MGQESEGGKEGATRLVWNELLLIPVGFLVCHILDHNSEFLFKFLAQVLRRFLINIFAIFFFERVVLSLVLALPFLSKLVLLLFLKVIQRNMNGSSAMQ